MKRFWRDAQVRYERCCVGASATDLARRRRLLISSRGHLLWVGRGHTPFMPAPLPPIAPHTRVKLHSLKSAPQHNDRVGLITNVADGGRFAVKLGSGEVLAVKPANLSRVK